jgi:type III pantothenate kinase
MQNGHVTLCLDFGNTRQKAGVFYGNKLQKIIFLESNIAESLAAVLDLYQPKKSILSSVISHNACVEDLLASKTQFHLLTAASKLPFTIPAGKPDTVGADRLALCAAAVLLYPHKNNLVIGTGTAVTYNFINNQHQFLGGGISPGLYMRMQALNNFTAKLPLIKPNWNVPLVGYDTETNIQSGVILGLAKEIDGFIEAYENKDRAFNVLLTGGDLVYLEPHLKTLIFADPDLLFKGLYAISEINGLG